MKNIYKITIIIDNIMLYIIFLIYSMISKMDNKHNNQILLNEIYKATSPNKDLYYSYFNFQKKEFPKKIGFAVISSYIGGCAFGLFMLAFSMLGSTRMEQINGKMDMYKDMTEFKKAIKTKVFHPIHRNGMFVIRFTLTIGLFNAAMIYFPFTSNKFGNLYGVSLFEVFSLFFLPFLIISRIKMRVYSKIAVMITPLFLYMICRSRIQEYKIKNSYV